MRDRDWLEAHGFVVGARDRNLNRAFKGCYMVAEAYEPGTVTDDGRNGPWCIVGNDLSALIREAVGYWR